MSQYRNSRNLIYHVCFSCLLAEEHANTGVPWAGRVILRSSAEGAEEAGRSPPGCAGSSLPTLPGHFLHPKPVKITNQRGDVTKCTAEAPRAFNLGDKRARWKVSAA